MLSDHRDATNCTDHRCFGVCLLHTKQTARMRGEGAQLMCETTQYSSLYFVRAMKALWVVENFIKTPVKQS